MHIEMHRKRNKKIERKKESVTFQIQREIHRREEFVDVYRNEYKKELEKIERNKK